MDSRQGSSNSTQNNNQNDYHFHNVASYGQTNQQSIPPTPSLPLENIYNFQQLQDTSNEHINQQYNFSASFQTPTFFGNSQQNSTPSTTINNTEYLYAHLLKQQEIIRQKDEENRKLREMLNIQQATTPSTSTTPSSSSSTSSAPQEYGQPQQYYDELNAKDLLNLIVSPPTPIQSNNGDAFYYVPLSKQKYDTFPQSFVSYLSDPHSIQSSSTTVPPNFVHHIPSNTISSKNSLKRKTNEEDQDNVIAKKLKTSGGLELLDEQESVVLNLKKHSTILKSILNFNANSNWNEMIAIFAK